MCDIGVFAYLRALFFWNSDEFGQVSVDSERAFSDSLLVNGYNRFSLPTYWGTGETASVDGTRWDVYENNLVSEYHVRYGSYGGIGYYHGYFCTTPRKGAFEVRNRFLLYHAVG